MLVYPRIINNNIYIYQYIPNHWGLFILGFTTLKGMNIAVSCFDVETRAAWFWTMAISETKTWFCCSWVPADHGYPAKIGKNAEIAQKKLIDPDFTNTDPVCSWICANFSWWLNHVKSPCLIVPSCMNSLCVVTQRGSENPPSNTTIIIPMVDEKFLTSCTGISL